MKVQLANPISMSTKWEDRNIFDIDAPSLEAAAYLAVRQTHEFLTDDNHTHETGAGEFTWGGERVRFNSVTISRNEKSEREFPYRGPALLETDYWFAVEYRSPPTSTENAP